MFCDKCGYHYAEDITHVCPNGMNQTSGYKCQLCGQWVIYGWTHICGKSNELYKWLKRAADSLERIANALEGLQKDDQGALKVRVK